MAMYVFSTAGDAVGFVYESFIFDLSGTPLGRILGSRVHAMDGSYVAEWIHQMVVDRRTEIPRAISPVSPPPRHAPLTAGYQRRPVAEHGRYPDAFARLYEAEVAIAAE